MSCARTPARAEGEELVFGDSRAVTGAPVRVEGLPRGIAMVVCEGKEEVGAGRAKSGEASEGTSESSGRDDGVEVALDAQEEANTSVGSLGEDKMLARAIAASLGPDCKLNDNFDHTRNYRKDPGADGEETEDELERTWVRVGEVAAVIGFHRKDGLRYWYVGRVVEVNRELTEAKLWWMKDMGRDQYRQVPSNTECWWESVESLIRVPRPVEVAWNADLPVRIDSEFFKHVPLGGEAARLEREMAGGKKTRPKQKGENTAMGSKRPRGASAGLASRLKARSVSGPASVPASVPVPRKRQKKSVEVRGRNPNIIALRRKGVLTCVKIVNNRTLEIGQAVYVNNADDKAKPYIAVIEGFGFALPDAMLLPHERGGVAARALEDGHDSATQVGKCLKLLRGGREPLSDHEAEIDGFCVDEETGNEVYVDMDVFVVLRWLYQARDLPEGVLPAHFTPGMREIFFSDHLDINPLETIIMGLGRSLNVLELKEYCREVRKNDGEGANFWYRMRYLSRVGKLDPSPAKFDRLCLCRQPHDPDMSCIKCLSCGEWFHLACIGHSTNTLPLSSEPGAHVPVQAGAIRMRLKGKRYKCIRCMASNVGAYPVPSKSSADDDVAKKSRATAAEKRREEANRVKDVMSRLRPLGNGGRKVVNFSLFLCKHGSNPNDHKTNSRAVTYVGLKYIVGALRNAEIGPIVFPGWTLRFYVDDSVDIPQYAEAMETLRRLPHCEVVTFEEPRARDLTTKGHVNLFGTLSRFFGLDDPMAAACICRDVDNLLTAADYEMVENWLCETRSACQIHRIFDRDYSWPILGGGFGARLPLPFSVTNLVNEFITEELVRDPNELGVVPEITKRRFGYFVDQRFLRDKLLPALEINDVHCKTDLVSIESTFMEGKHAMHSKNTVYWNTVRYTELMPHATRSILPKTKLVQKFLSERIHAVLVASGLALGKGGGRSRGRPSTTDHAISADENASISRNDESFAMERSVLANPVKDGFDRSRPFVDDGVGIGSFPDDDSDTYEDLSRDDGDMSPSDGDLSPLPSPALAPRVR